MNKLRMVGLLMVGVLFLAACSGGMAGASEDGFDFTEDDAADQGGSEGMDFSEEEVAEPGGEEGMDFTDDGPTDSDDEPEMDTPEDEAPDTSPGDGFDFSEDPEGDTEDDADVPAEGDPVLPPEGTTTWQITYEEGTITCPDLTQTFPTSPPQTVTIQYGADGDALLVKGMGDAPEIFFILINALPGESFYNGYLDVPGSDVEILYDMVFTSQAGLETADFIVGTITSEQQGCSVLRGFEGTLVQ